jgi:putative transposase
LPSCSAGQRAPFPTLAVGKFYDWRKRYGERNCHSGKVPRDFWRRNWERQKILDFQTQYPDAGYRRLTYMLLDADMVADSPASVWRVLRQAGRLRRNGSSPSKKGTAFVQPLAAHEHWQIDIAHIKIHGTFYYLCAVLDRASRYLVAWDLRASMNEGEVEVLSERAKERFRKRGRGSSPTTVPSSSQRTSRSSSGFRA